MLQTTIKRYKETSSMHNHPGQDQKRCTTISEDRWMKNILLRDERKREGFSRLEQLSMVIKLKPIKLLSKSCLHELCAFSYFNY